MCLFRKAILEKRNISLEINLEENGFSRKILDIATSFLTNESDEIVGLVAVIRDVTEIKSLNEEVARNNRLASLGKLSAGIAHEIRNPLSSVRGLAQFISKSLKKDDTRREDLDTIIQEVDRLNHLIIQVLDFAKIKKLNLSYFSINGLIKKIVDLLRIETVNKKIKFHLLLSEKIQNIYADENQIRQILLNIIVNSIQAINFQGDIFVTSNVIQFREKPGVKIMIEDNGTGIPESDIPKVFDPFFTKKEKGTGLGLSIVYKLVENHQGEVKLESKEGSGTKFTIFLPQKGEK
jgi:signal transduction histidine kinase